MIIFIFMTLTIQLNTFTFTQRTKEVGIDFIIYVYFIQHLTINWCLSHSFSRHKFSLLSEHSNNVGWYPFRKGWQKASLVIPGLLAQTDPDKWLWHWLRLYRSGFSLQTFNGNSKSHWLASKSRESLAQTSTGNWKEHWLASRSKSFTQTSTGSL